MGNSVEGGYTVHTALLLAFIASIVEIDSILNHINKIIILALIIKKEFVIRLFNLLNIILNPVIRNEMTENIIKRMNNGEITRYESWNEKSIASIKKFPNPK